jgi:D-3-phosphoglycerate dehydrogenase
LIADDVHPVLIETLQAAGMEVDYKPLAEKQEIISLLQNTDAMVLRSKILIDTHILNLAGRLRLIARAGAGLDTIDVEAAQKKGIEVIHAGEGNADAVAEHTMGMMLNLLSKISSSDRSLRQGLWNREKFRGLELSGKTVGIIGYGNMGRALAKRLTSFGCNVLAYDKYLNQLPDQNARQVDLSELQLRADIISLHIPLTAETMNWIGLSFFERCKKGLLFLNTSRGKIVNLEELNQAMEIKWVALAGLDVFEDEPIPMAGKKIPSKYMNLFQREEVLVSPHVAGWSLESYEKISSVLADKILHFFGLEKVKNGPKWV